MSGVHIPGSAGEGTKPRFWHFSGPACASSTANYPVIKELNYKNLF